MVPRFLRHAAGLLPPPARRAASGAMLDLLSLPARMTSLERRGEPWQALHNVGGGDFAQAGRDNLRLLIDRAGLEPSSRVLDIGCGAGRMAAPLADWLDPGAGYVGFDLSASAIAACRRRLGTKRDDFTFLHADIRNREYRARGSILETAFRFPVEDASIDIALATSVFSHMTLESIAHYLGEARRVLRPGGRFLFTAYALTPDRIAALGRSECQLPFKPWRGGAMVIDAKSPERAIAHPLPDLPGGAAFGCWLPPSAYAGGQDLFVAVRPG
jgi:SAM-dependent methyltransferase